VFGFIRSYPLLSVAKTGLDVFIPSTGRIPAAQLRRPRVKNGAGI